LPRFAPEIFRQRLLIEGYFTRPVVDEAAIRGYFDAITDGLGLRTYGDPIVHRTSGQGRPENEGYDAFVPLIDSGIYVCVWTGPRFVSSIIYTCAAFDEAVAAAVTREHFQIGDYETASF
jgi:S-adenosylmethionine decarboxylase